MSTLRIVRKAPGEAAEIREIASTLEGLQAEIGGWIEQVYPPLRLAGSRFSILVDEEGLAKGLTFNREHRGHRLHGPIVITAQADDEGREVSLSPEEAATLVAYFDGALS